MRYKLIFSYISGDLIELRLQIVSCKSEVGSRSVLLANVSSRTDVRDLRFIIWINALVNAGINLCSRHYVRNGTASLDL